MKDLKDILLMVLISSAIFVILDNNKHRAPSDLRDALNEPAAAGPGSGASLKSVTPNAGVTAALVNPPVTDWTAYVKAKERDKDTVVSETFSDKKMSEWATYVKDNEGDTDVIVSAVFPDKKTAGNALSAEESRLTTGGSSILFSCLLRETAGGVFFVVRLAPAQAAAALPARAAKGEASYIAALKKAADNVETECLNTLDSGSRNR